MRHVKGTVAVVTVDAVATNGGSRAAPTGAIGVVDVIEIPMKAEHRSLRRREVSRTSKECTAQSSRHLAQRDKFRLFGAGYRISHARTADTLRLSIYLDKFHVVKVY